MWGKGDMSAGLRWLIEESKSIIVSIEEVEQDRGYRNWHILHNKRTQQ